MKLFLYLFSIIFIFSSCASNKKQTKCDRFKVTKQDIDNKKPENVLLDVFLFGACCESNNCDEECQ